ncbi:MAG: hypothetical protein JWL95_665 [Gemmatimonadetes bacterium]|nr:hypothetical protein [Gemmatimonadota bacterium]
MSTATAGASRATGAGHTRTGYAAGRAPARLAASVSPSVAPVNALHGSAGNGAVTALLHASPNDASDLLPATVRDSVRDAVRAPGESLDVQSRHEMEGVFGRELGGVRIHRDAAAARSAESLGALAYTAGSRIVFGPGRYSPATPEGRVLLAHELAHVIQQRDASRVEPRVGRTHDLFEHAAESGGDASWLGRGVAIPAVQRQPKPGTKDPGPPTMDVGTTKVIDPAELAKKLSPAELLKFTIEFFTNQQKIYAGVKSAAGSDEFVGQLLRLWKRTVEVSIGVLHDRLSDDAALTSQLKTAYAAATAAAVAVYAAALKKTTHELLQAHRDDVHEWGWPAHVADANADTLSDAIPEADRKRIKVVSTTSILAGQINVGDLFSGTTTIGIPEGVEVAFSGGIAAKLQPGLRNVAGTLRGQMTPPPLVIDSTISLALDLGKVGGDYAMYRFTLFTQHAKGKPATRRLLIERLGALGMEGLAPSASAEAQRRFTAHRFTFRGTWTPEARQTVLGAVAIIPDTQLTLVDGMTFARSGDDAARPNEAGNYSADTHVITLFDRAFGASLIRHGAPGAGVVTSDVYDVAHEIGHAIDYRAYRQGNANATAATTALRAEFGQFESPAGSMNFEGVPNARMPRLRTLLAAQAATQNAADKPKTESGHVLKAGVLENDPKAKTAFREAMTKDGGVRPTAYSDTAWEEAFAEAYALYTTDNATLRRLRPSVHAFLVKKFPR